jgi:acyl-CoA synthetase (AMP-forming)/AMP-acid ligase II
LCVLPHEQRQLHPDAAGFPLPGFDVFIDETDDGNDFGEICLSGPTIMRGYWRSGGNLEPLEGSIFRTGDLGFMRNDGLVTVSGRRDDVFKVGAEKVDRHSIELALQSTLA